MHLHLFIPSQSLAQALQSGRESVLPRLIAKAEFETLDLSMEMLICRQAGLELKSESLQVDSVPFAAISYLGEDLPESSPSVDDGYFLFADPVHLILQRDSFSLSSPVPLALSSAESESLLESLNGHFVSDGLKFIPGASGHWYLQQANQPQIATSHPELAVNRDINAFLPQGPDAARWNQLINEIQMLLFSHPVNEVRESNGLPPCNSLWFWGGGKLPKTDITEFGAVYASLPLMKGLCRMSGKRCREIPADFPVIDPHEMTWISFDESHPVTDGCLHAATDALRRGNVQTLRLYFSINGKVLKASLQRRDLWKFWRKNSALLKYLEA